MDLTDAPKTEFAVLAQDEREDPIVSVIVKRTYTIGTDGTLRPADEQIPLVQEERFESHDQRPCEITTAEIDTWPFKTATDVVIQGKVHAEGGRPVTEMMAGIQIGGYGKVVQAIGDRGVDHSPGGRLAFTPPDPFTEMELTYRRAYGGIDMALTRTEPETLLELMVAMNSEERPGAYPRNPAGVGYVVRDEPLTLEYCRLPNFEDPRNRLTAERLVVGDPARWWTMPMPQGFGWFHQTWYPRGAYAGVLPEHAPPDDTDRVEEARMGYITRGRSRVLLADKLEDWFDVRFSNGASPGLVLPYLKGDEPVRLVGMAPEGEIRFALPGVRPDVSIRFQRKALKEKLYCHTVLIEPDLRRVCVVWCARAKTPRVLPDKVPTNDDPMYDMLDGFEIRVDGVEFPHQPEMFKVPDYG